MAKLITNTCVITSKQLCESRNKHLFLNVPKLKIIHKKADQGGGSMVKTGRWGQPGGGSRVGLGEWGQEGAGRQGGGGRRASGWGQPVGQRTSAVLFFFPRRPALRHCSSAARGSGTITSCDSPP